MSIGLAWACVAFAVAATCIGQLLLRHASVRGARRELVLGVLAFGAAVAVNYLAARVLGIGPVTAASAFGFVLLPWAAARWLGETTAPRQRLATWLIVMGIALYAL